MRLSSDRISHIAHLVVDGIWKDDLVDYSDDERALQEVKDAITGFLQVEDDIDTAVRNKIRSLSKDIPEGSREWDVLFKKYFEEEMNKKKGFL